MRLLRSSNLVIAGLDRTGWIDAARRLLKRRGKAAAMHALIFLLCVAIPILPARAVQPDEVLPDARLEARARTLSTELRCLVCQNQSIDDSDAPLARDLRILIRDRLKAGDSDDQVIAYLVDRYGEFVLLKPRLHPGTLLLWFGPFAVLGLGILAVMRLRRPAPGVAENALDEEERRRLSEIVRDA